MRCFVALPVDDREVVASLKEATGNLPFSAIRWVRADQFHFTLKFLGEVPDDRLSAVRDVVAKSAGGFAGFEITLEGLGAFPATGPPRVVWAGCGAGSESLVSLSRAIEGGFESAGFPKEPRPFSPHLTLGRVKDPRTLPLRSFREALLRSTAIPFGTIAVHEVVLFRSDFSPAGPAYAALSRFPLSIS